MKHRQYAGFTLIEILVVVGLIAILAAVTIVAINPAKNFEQTRDAQRSSDVTVILNAVTQYTSEEGRTINTLLDESGIIDADTDGDFTDEVNVLCGAGVGYRRIGTGAGATDIDVNLTNDNLEFIDLNATLVDEYIVSVPNDPSRAASWPSVTPSLFDTGYRMCVTAGGRVTISAVPERAASISVSR